MYLINVRETRRDNQEWKIQRHWQDWAHKTQSRCWLETKSFLPPLLEKSCYLW